MDADAEICRLFGSLNLAGFTPVQPQVVNEVKQVRTLLLRLAGLLILISG